MIDEPLLSALPELQAMYADSDGQRAPPSRAIRSISTKVQGAFACVEKFVKMAQDMSSGKAIPWSQVLLFSEFSGYGTAELALQSVIAKSKETTGQEVMCRATSGDVNAMCRTLLSENVGGCVFGDIMNVAGDDLRKKLTAEVPETFKIKPKDVVAAVQAAGSFDKLFTKEGRLRKALGHAVQDCKLLHACKSQSQGLEGAKGKLKNLLTNDGAKPLYFVFSRRTVTAREI